MQPLTDVALPAPAASRFAAACQGHRLARAANLPFALGLVLPLLARNAPFANAPLGLRVPLTAGELSRGHHLIVLREWTAVAYAGWAACTEEQGRLFLGSKGIAALDFTRREGDAIAFLTWTAADTGAMTALKTAMRGLHASTRYFARRSHATPSGAAARPVVPRGGVITALSGLPNRR
jgi:hypothetical protein